MNEIGDQLLVQRILQGDSACFEVLCRRYYVSLQAIAYAVLMDEHLAEDAAQETFATVCRSLAKLRHPEKVGAWMAAICRNTARDMVRRESKRKPLSGSESIGILHNNETDDYVLQAVKQLPVSLREIVVMRYFDEMSYRQMQQVLGLSQQAINGRLRRAKKKLKHFLKLQGFRSDGS